MTVLDVALLLANDKALLAGVLDLMLPRLLDQMQADRRMAMVQGCDRSLARVLGWLVKEGQASALTSTSIPDLLDAVIEKNDPRTFGFPPMEVPRLADSSKPFRVAMSK